MRFSWLLLVVAVVTYAAPKRGAAETIEVHGCDPGKILLENGDAWSCVDDPTSGGPGGGGPSGGGGDSGGGGGGGGATDPRDNWDGKIDVKEQIRKWRCSQCKQNAMKCTDQAKLAEISCRQNFADMASARCTRPYEELGTVTAWGCSIESHLLNTCGGVEPPWNDSSKWTYECTPGRRAPKCSGPGINSCKTSWAQSHPGGTTQVVDTYELHVEFEKVGGASASQSISATCNLTTATGYNAACTTAGGALATGCTEQQTACYASYNCTEADFPK